MRGGTRTIITHHHTQLTAMVAEMDEKQPSAQCLTPPPLHTTRRRPTHTHTQLTAMAAEMEENPTQLPSTALELPGLKPGAK